MEESIKIESEVINDEKQPKIDDNLMDNSPPPQNEEIDQKDNPENNEKENGIKSNDIIINEEEEKKIIKDNNINNISDDKSNIFQFPLRNNVKSFNFDKNLSKEEKLEQIENNLHSLLSELSNIKNKGNTFFNNKNYEAAEQQYREGIQKINEFLMISNIDEVNGQIQENIMNINLFNLQFYNNLSTVLIKQEKFEESLKNSEFIIQNLDQEHVNSYCRILFCLIELKKIITANHYADIIRKKFENKECYSKFRDQLARLEVLNKEFSEKILDQNPELKKEVITMNDNLIIKNNEEKEKTDLKKYLPYLVGGAVILFAGGRYLYNKYKNK
jgi:hypothetical protein